MFCILVAELSTDYLVASDRFFFLRIIMAGAGPSTTTINLGVLSDNEL